MQQNLQYIFPPPLSPFLGSALLHLAAESVQGRAEDEGSWSVDVASATLSFSRETLLIVLPCANLAFLRPETVLHGVLQLAWEPPEASGSPSKKLPQHSSPSESRPFSGSTACSSVGLSTSLCSSMGFSMGCKMTFPPLLISESCKGSACHLSMS